MSTPREPPITVSRADLRAELALLELRLYQRIDDSLGHKADAATVLSLLARVDAVERGDFPPSMARALAEKIEEHTATRTSQSWSKRDRMIGLFVAGVMTCGLLVAVASLIVNFVGVHR